MFSKKTGVIFIALLLVSSGLVIPTATAQDTGGQIDTLGEFTETIQDTDGLTEQEYREVVFYYNQIGHDNPLNLDSEQEQLYEEYINQGQEQTGLSPDEILNQYQQQQQQDEETSSSSNTADQQEQTQQEENTQEENYPSERTLWATESVTLHDIQIDEERGQTLLYVSSDGSNSYIWFTEDNYGSGTLDDGENTIVLQEEANRVGFGAGGTYDTHRVQGTILQNYLSGNVDWQDLGLGVLVGAIAAALAIVRKYKMRDRSGDNYVYSILEQKEIKFGEDAGEQTNWGRIKSILYTDAETISFTAMTVILASIDLYTGGQVRSTLINMDLVYRVILTGAVLGYATGYIALASYVIEKIIDQTRDNLLLILGNSDKEIDMLEMGDTAFNDAEINEVTDLAKFTIPQSNEVVHIAREYVRETHTLIANWRKIATPTQIERAIINIDRSHRILTQEIDQAREINRKLPALVDQIRSEAAEKVQHQQDYIDRQSGDKSLDRILNENLTNYDPVDSDDLDVQTGDEYEDIVERNEGDEESSSSTEE